MGISYIVITLRHRTVICMNLKYICVSGCMATTMYMIITATMLLDKRKICQEER